MVVGWVVETEGAAVSIAGTPTWVLFRQSSQRLWGGRLGFGDSLIECGDEIDAYSERKVIAGSIEAARRAGMYPETRAVNRKISAIAMKVNGS